MSQSRAFLLTMPIVCFLASATLAQTATYRVDAVDGTGVAGVGTLSGPGIPVIREDGTLVFTSSLLRIGSVTASNDSLIVSGIPGAYSAVVREGSIAPGTDGLAFDRLVRPTVGEESLAFYGLLRGAPAENDGGLWLSRPSGLTLAAREGAPAPGVATGAFGTFQGEPILRGSLVAFASTLSGTGSAADDFALFSTSGDTTRLIAREGDLAPSTNGLTFSEFPRFNADAVGNVYFRATLNGATALNDQGVWGSVNGKLSLVAQKGSPVPGMPAGFFFTSVTSPVTAGAQQIAFSSIIAGPGSSGANDQILWTNRTGTPEIIFREEQSAAGLLELTYGNIASDLAMSKDGRVVFATNLRGPGVNADNDTAIFLGSPGRVELIYRENATDGNWNSISPQRLTANANGMVAGLVSESSSSIMALRARDPFGAFTRITRVGEKFDLDPGPATGYRIVGPITMWGGDSISFYRNALNDAGQLTAWISFPGATSDYSASFTFRIGGAVRVHQTAPICGPAVGNGFDVANLPLPGQAFDVDGDSGYVRYRPYSAGQNVLAYLDLDATQAGLTTLFAEIESGRTPYGYSWKQNPVFGTTDPLGEFQLLITFNPAVGSQYSTFYWNFANIPGVSGVDRVVIVPECASSFGCALVSLRLITRRRRESILNRS